MLEQLQALGGSNKMGIDFNSKLVENALGVLSGKVKVQDLPEYQFMKNMMLNLQKMKTTEAMKGLTARGVGGGALATTMSDMDENMNKAIMGMGEGAYKNTVGQGSQAAGVLGNQFSDFMGKFMAAVQARKNRHEGARQFNTKMWMDLGTKAAAAGAAPFTGGASLGMMKGSSGNGAAPTPEFDMNASPSSQFDPSKIWGNSTYLKY